MDRLLLGIIRVAVRLCGKALRRVRESSRFARTVKKLDLLESNHGFGLNVLSWESIQKRK
jgi:hypothetical protein